MSADPCPRCGGPQVLLLFSYACRDAACGTAKPARRPVTGGQRTIGPGLWRKFDSGPPPKGWTEVGWTASSKVTDADLASGKSRVVMFSRREIESMSIGKAPIANGRMGNAANLLTGEHWPTGHYDAVYRAPDQP